MIKRIKTHLCLVSDQPIPNLVPACDPHYRPERVLLVVSKPVERHAKYLKKVLANRKIESDFLWVDDPYNYTHIKERLESLLANFQEDEIALNASEGPKVLGFAAFDLFQERKWPVFCVEPERDQMIWLQPKPFNRDIPDRLYLEDFLAAHGYTVNSLERTHPDERYAQVGQVIIERQEEFSDALGSLNYYAGTAEHADELRSQMIEPGLQKNAHFKQLIRLFADAGLVTYKDHSLYFPNEDARFFANGGWLEDYLLAKVRSLGKKRLLQDVAKSVHVEARCGSKNELDLAILYNNRLFLIECKTRKFTGSGAKRGGGANTLYKMDCLKDLGGSMAETMLVSYKKIGETDRCRANDLDIDVFAGKSLKKIEQHLENWIFS